MKNVFYFLLMLAAAVSVKMYMADSHKEDQSSQFWEAMSKQAYNCWGAKGHQIDEITVASNCKVDSENKSITYIYSVNANSNQLNVTPEIISSMKNETLQKRKGTDNERVFRQWGVTAIYSYYSNDGVLVGSYTIYPNE